MRRAPEPGELVALALGAAGLCSSVVLVRKGLRPVSTCWRTSWLLRIVGTYFWLHLTFRLPFDPLRAIGARLVPPPPVWSGGGGGLP